MRNAMMNAENLSMKVSSVLLTVGVLAMTACSSAEGQRGVADQRSHFAQFIPMRQDPARDGLKEVRPFFNHANRTEIMRAIEHACVGDKAGSSVYDPRSGRGYYVNCNPRNRQLLNGYVPSNPRREPHSRQ